MKKPFLVFALLVASCWAPSSFADDEFYGKLESRPDGKIGTWVIGGRTFEATDQTEIEEDFGALKPGACVEVEYENAMVEEIESKKMAKCNK